MSLTDYNHRLQRCHSEKIKSPIWPNKKNQENPRSNFYTFPYNFRKKSTVPRKKSTFPEKNSFLSAKNSDDFFFSHQLSFSNFAPPFSNFHPFPAKIYLPNSLKFVTFSKNPLKYMYFLMKCEKTLEKTQGPQTKTQEPKIRSKNPRSWEKTQGVATLVRRAYFAFDSAPLVLDLRLVRCIGLLVWDPRKGTHRTLST